MGISKKKKGSKKLLKRLKKQKTVFVYVTEFPAEKTLFPEKLKKANELLAKAKMSNL